MWNAVLISKLCKKVITYEIVDELIEKAEKN
jgi:protein-L-isoaspartate O-methyltransferase